MNTQDNTFSDEDPTLVVQVPAIRQPARPCDGYGFHCRAPMETDIATIPNDEWDIQVLDMTGNTAVYPYMGLTTIDQQSCHVWWMGETEGFIAQSITGC